MQNRLTISIDETLQGLILLSLQDHKSPTSQLGQISLNIPAKWEKYGR